MTFKHLLILLLALFTTSLAQNDDELHIPMENDNQFPPEKHSELDLAPEIEGSGAGAIEEPLETTTDSPALFIEDVQLSSTLVNNETETADELSCPKECVCNTEGDTNNYVVDCSNAELTELPKPMDSKTTTLNLQNNKLTEIPQSISELKNLKILNVNNNEIMDIKAGSVSELPELVSLKLENNRLIEYPTDLKNSFGLTKLEELDLGGNDMRTALTSETFLSFKALQKLTLPSAAGDLAVDICAQLKESLEIVCIGSCSNKSIECPDAPEIMDDELSVSLPGLIAVDKEPEDYIDPIISTTQAPNSDIENKKADEITPTAVVETKGDNTTVAETTNAPTTAEPSFRSAVIQASYDAPKPDTSKPVENTEPEKIEPNGKVTTKSDDEVVGAATSTTQTGGVDKSLIAIIVGGMIVVVAGITIKKNWSSIRNRLSSSPRNANGRTSGVTANGNTPEEVPLQEKSPV